MNDIIIIIKGGRTGDARYNIKMEEAELLLLKMSLSEREKSNNN